MYIFAADTLILYLFLVSLADSDFVYTLLPTTISFLIVIYSKMCEIYNKCDL